jgi:hypothetical protein
MNELLNQLIGAGSLGFGEEGVRLGFARPIQAWGWALIVLGAAALSGWSYWKLDASIRSRFALASLRTLLLLLLVLLISGPRLIRPNETIEKDWVVVLLDRSASMTVKDAPGSAAPTGAPGPRISRDQQLRESLGAAYESMRQLASERQLLVLGFDAGAYPIRTIGDGGAGAEGAQGVLTGGYEGLEIPDPSGARTALNATIRQALARVAARPVAGIVLLTDGRTSDAPDKAIVRRLQAERIPVFALPLGSPDPVGDLAISRVEAPAVAFVRDTIPVEVRVQRRGSLMDSTAGTIELVDDLTGRVLQSRPLSEGIVDQTDPTSLSLTLTSSDTDAGSRNWSVRVVPERPDLISENNASAFVIDLLDRPIRTLYVDGYPRWEYRYLKNVLIREGSITSSNLLLAIDKRFLQEGDELIRSMPRSSEEWAAYDVVMIGDLRADLFTTEQLQQLREHVAVRGGGLLWIAGPGATPGTWSETPLADLLPFSMGGSMGSGGRGGAGAGGVSGREGLRVWDRSVVVRPTPASERLGILNLAEPRGWPAQLADPDTGWSLLRWAQRIDPARVKPSAEVLAEAVPVGTAADGSSAPAPTPLVLTMRYGAGRVIYVATDETWRWRYARGETLQERFWLPLVRLLARDSVARTGQPATLELSQNQATIDQTIRIAVRLIDQSLAEAAPETLRVTLTPVGEGSIGRAPIELRLRDEGGGGGGLGGGLGAGLRTYSTTWIAAEPGEFRVDASDPLLAVLRLEAPLTIVPPDDEMRQPETDHGLLAELVAATDGQLLAAQDLTRLSEILPNRQLKLVATPETRDLWDTPPVLILFLTLLGLEWIGRKWIRLI